MRRLSIIRIGLATLLLAAVPAVAMALTVTLEFDRAFIDRSSREAVMTGIYECDAGTTGTITAVLTQGNHEAGGTVPLVCTDSEQTWEVRVPLGTPPFHPGPATVDLGFFATDGTDSIVSGRHLEITLEPR